MITMASGTARNVDSIITDVVDEIHSKATSVLDGEALAMLAWMEGLLTAAAIGPERTRPDEWLQALPTDLSSGPSGMGEALLGILGLRHNQILTAVKRDGEAYEPAFLDDADEHEMVPLAKEFAAGFRRGMHLRSGSWSSITRDDHAGNALVTIAVFLKDSGTGEAATDIQENQDRRLPYLGLAIHDIYRYWTQRRRTAPAPVNPLAKLGRNAMCPCGSGHKYKRCCMN